jgi:hypothetical protein
MRSKLAMGKVDGQCLGSPISTINMEVMCK